MKTSILNQVLQSHSLSVYCAVVRLCVNSHLLQEASVRGVESGIDLCVDGYSSMSLGVILLLVLLTNFIMLKGTVLNY